VRGWGDAVCLSFGVGQYVYGVGVWIIGGMSVVRCVIGSGLAGDVVSDGDGLFVVGAGSGFRSVFDQRGFAGYYLYAVVVADERDAVPVGVVYRVWEFAESYEDHVVGIQDDVEYAGGDVFVCRVGLREYGGDDDCGLGVLSAELAVWKASFTRYRAMVRATRSRVLKTTARIAGIRPASRVGC
jgi:hypothetical protein